MSKAKLHRGIPEQLCSKNSHPVLWKFGWSFERTLSGAVIIKKVDEVTNKLVAEATIPGSDWVKLIGGLSLKDDDLCRGILKVLHS